MRAATAAVIGGLIGTLATACSAKAVAPAVDMVASSVEALVYTGATGPDPRLERRAGNTPDLHLWGGPEKSEYLGCISCHPDDPRATPPDGGHFVDGRRRLVPIDGSIYADASSQYSICNEDATDPPELRDETGFRLGVLTVRIDHPDAVHSERVTPWLVRWCGSRGAATTPAPR